MDPAVPSGLRARLFVLMQYLIPQHLLSRGVYYATRARTPAIKNLLISGFMRNFRPDMSDAAQPDPLSYLSFNDFFTRALRPGARPVSPDSATLVSPVDGAISQICRLRGTQLLQAKGHDYSLQALLADPGYLEAFNDGSFATLYLAPFNYHRVHMPLDGVLQAAWYVPGRLFSVNTTTAAAVPGLFARNERIVCIFEHGGLPFAMILVGALFVGSMTTVWHGEVTARRPDRPQPLAIEDHLAPLRLLKGAEMGRFNMGSTVILLLPPGLGDWLPGVAPGQAVSVGHPLGRIRV
jgi:phosphatidylserine decarboxylase